MPTPEIHERLDRLERSNRSLKAVLAVSLCCAVALVVMGANSPAPKVIEAQKVILRDNAGNERGELFATDTSWGLVLFNKNNKQAASLVVGSELNGLVLLDQNGNIRQTLTSNMDESAWNLFRPGSDSAQFAVTDNVQGTALTVRDRANNDRVSLGASPKGAAIVLADKDGAPRTIMADSHLGFVTFSKEGELEWSPGWDKMSPEEQKKIRALMQNLTK
jgi:hypothetical protein